jgi:hypothetical protein
MGDDIRIQKRTYRKMSDVFAITGGYMQLISTIFSIITFLTNKIDIEVQLVNNLFNFYPKKKKLTLRHKLQQLPFDSQDIFKKYYSFGKMKNTNTNASYKNSVLDKSRSSLNKCNSLINSRKINSIINVKKKKLYEYKK